MTERNEVPCNGCRACCKGERVVLALDRGDSLDDYWTTPVEINGEIVPTIAHKPNGECVYLTTHGCAVHANAPWACRTFDCRRWFRKLDAFEPLLQVDDLEGEVAAAALKRL